MKNILLTLTSFFLTLFSHAQISSNEPYLISDHSSDNQEIRDILSFQGIEYHKLTFGGQELADKTYKITVKEIWNGTVKNETTVFNSAEIGIKQFETVNDTVLKLRVLGQYTADNKLKMDFRFDRFTVSKEYDATAKNRYSLRNMVAESNMFIGYDEPFYLFAYILPYEREDGSSSWCEVGTSGENIDQWGKDFNIEHYLVFEMIFE